MVLDFRTEGIKVVLLNPGWVWIEMSGPYALFSMGQSVTRMIGVVEEMTSEMSGLFLNYHDESLPW